MDIASPVIDVSREKDSQPSPQDNKPLFNHSIGNNIMKTDITPTIGYKKSKFSVTGNQEITIHIEYM